MNRFAFLSTAFALKRLYRLSNARTAISGEENIPDGPVIFTVNHFTRIETLFLPYHLEEITGRPIWSLAHHALFTGAMAGFLEKGGAVSTAAPDRDSLIIKSLLMDEARWIIFPEGSMVKSKKVVSEDGFIVDNGEEKKRPRTGAANLALRAEFYRRRILHHRAEEGREAAMEVCRPFEVESPEGVTDKAVHIVPVNITYYPLRVRENALNRLAAFLVDALPQRVSEELMTEGSMLLDGVDVDIRFGRPLEAGAYLEDSVITSDIESPCPFGPDDPIASLDALRQAAVTLMQDYMAAIYAMTTVNPDHLFASILREMPGDLIDPEDLRRRVYLAATLRLDSQRLYLHRSLEYSQIHLITDDRFGRCEDFFRYAQDTGVLLSAENGVFRRNSAKLSADYDFHDIRVANPIAVMANEIEPLALLRPHLTRLARETSFHIQRRLVAHLLEKGVRSFEKARSRYGFQHEFMDKEAGRPFFLEGMPGRAGVLLIHGYLSLPARMQALGDILQKKGFWVYGVRLPGHGTSLEDLEKAKAGQWEDAVLEGYALLHVLCGKVAAVGVSLGGLLASLLAVRIPGLRALCLVGVPSRIQEYRLCDEPGSAIWDRIFSRIRTGKKEKMRLPCGLEASGMGYREHSETVFREMALLAEKVRTGVPLIRVPCMVLQGRKDPLVAPEAAPEIFKRLETAHKELYLADSLFHDILSEDGGERIWDLITGFLTRWEG
ncbi:esterase/lipase [Desulfobotulus alkaliphilus]|uniref:Esterase/lipase n=1 Tax=Desulfobotulus alkaliphilus TaxID=622671 RepID=A0A562RT43_9BACT|nr:alpha/beta fold hydrolase [Desulfobotulus alkaliphilus]TWI72241.1 esterase/lipase [Desulfobotulus alkaliphilus]